MRNSFIPVRKVPESFSIKDFSIKTTNRNKGKGKIFINESSTNEYFEMNIFHMNAILSVSWPVQPGEVDLSLLRKREMKSLEIIQRIWLHKTWSWERRIFFGHWKWWKI